MIRILRAVSIYLMCCSIAAAQSGTGWNTSGKNSADRGTTSDLARINALQDAVADAWQKTPLTQRRAIFVSANPESYGSYDERQSNVFQAGEKLISYVEPIGCTWTTDSDGIYNYGVSFDFLVKRADGKVLGGQEKLLNVNKRSRVRNQELMLVLSLTLDAIEPGDYLVEYKIHDNNSSKESKFTQRFAVRQ